MTVINPKSISGINSITTGSGSDNLLTIHNTNGTERFRIDSSGNTRITSGIVTTLSVTGVVDVDDYIKHTGDTNTAIRFPSADNISFETSGTERLRISDSSGESHVPITGSVAPSGTGATLMLKNLNTTANAINAIQGVDASGQTTSCINFYNTSDGTNEGYLSLFSRPASGSLTEGLRVLSGSGVGIGASLFHLADDNTLINFDTDQITFKTGGSERLRVNSVGKVGINSTAPDGMLAIEHTSSAPNLTMRNHPAAGVYTNNYGMELRHAFGSVQHGCLIHTQEADLGRRALDVSDSGGVFATFVNGRVGIKSDRPAVELNVTGQMRAQASGDSSSYTNIKNNQIYMDANGTGYLDIAHVGGNLQMRSSVSSALDTTGPLFTSTGNIAFANGKGIDFGASSGGSSTSELLDDYEEGTWSAGITYSSSNTGLNVTEGNGKYIRVGHLVHCTCLLSWDEGSASGNIVMTGLPFTIRNDSHVRLGGHAIYLDGFSNLSGSNIFLYNTGNMTTANMYNVSGDNDSHLGPADSSIDSGDTSNANTTRFMLHYYCQ